MANWTDEDVAAHEAKKAARREARKLAGEKPPVTQVNKLVKIMSNPYHPYRNRLEFDYAAYLDLLKLAGEIEDWRYEAIKFRLADGKWWKPDWLIARPWIERESGCHYTFMEIHETKGFDRTEAKLKRAVAAELFPWFTFFLVRRDAGGWQVTPVKEE